MKKFFYILFVILCSGLSVNALPQIKGQIVDSKTNEAVELADILLFVKDAAQPLHHTVSDPKGFFSFDNLKTGEYTLMIKLLGYDIYNHTGITIVNSSQTLNLGVLKMQQLEIGIAEVEVVAQRKQVVYKLDKRVIDASANLLSSGGTAVDVLENTPSIKVDADGEVSFRGSSGFVVYIDGKPSIFGGTQALEQVPSGQIEQIEIITNPSARHDAEGDVGIINIITKKHSNSGLSGMVNVSGNTVGSRAVNFLFSLQDSISRWSFGGSYNERIRKSDFEQEKTTIVNDLTTTSFSEGPRESNNFNYSLKAGWRGAFDKTTLYVDLEGGYGGRTRDGDLDYIETRVKTGVPDEEYHHNSRDRYHIDETFFLGILGFDHKFNKKDHKLTGSYYLRYGGDALEYFESELVDVNNTRQQGHKAWEDEIRWTMRGNLDYIYPYSESGRIEAGYQYYSYLEDGDYSMQFWDPEVMEFEDRQDIYNTFYFQRGINSVYGIWAESIKDFEFQAGIRGEHTHRVLRSSMEWANRTVNRMEFFPSVHLGYTFPNEHQLIGSYSYRTNRPELFFMEPYITYRDYYSAEKGNPDIRPEYIHSYELNYKKNIENNSITASVFHRKRKDKVERLRIPYEAGVTLDSMANVGHDYSTGFELNAQVVMAKGWDVNLNGSVYHYKVKNEFKTEGANEESTNYEIRLNNTFTLGKYTRLQLDGNFVGPSVTTQGRTDAFWYANLAARQQLFKRKLTATLAFRNFVNSARYVSEIITSDLQSLTRIKPHYPLLELTLSYTFNNFSIKGREEQTNHDLFEGTNH